MLDEFGFALEGEPDVVFGVGLEVEKRFFDFAGSGVALDDAGVDAFRADGPVDLIGGVLEVRVVASALGVEGRAEMGRVAGHFGDRRRGRRGDFGAGRPGRQREGADGKRENDE